MPGAFYYPMSYVAIIAPAVETDYRSNFAMEREANVHVAVMIAIVAMFIISWLMLSESTPARRALHGVTSRVAPKRSTLR